MRTLVRSCVAAACLFVASQTALSQVIFSETFNYAKTGGLVDCAALSVISPWYPQAAANLGAPDWIANSTSAFSAPVLVDTGAALTYPGYILSGMGKKLYCPNTDSGQSARRNFTAQTKVYYAMMVQIKHQYNLNTIPSDQNGTVIAGHGNSSSTYRGLLTFNRAATAGKIVAGISYQRDDLNTAWATAKELDTMKTFLVVVCTEPASGTSKLWINPDLSGKEPAPDAVCTGANGAEPAGKISSFLVYQRGDKPQAWLGGIRVGTTWETVTNIAPLPMVETFNYPAGALCDNAANLNATSPFYPLAANNVSSYLWINGSTSKNDDPILVDTTGALVYPGYPLSGQGKKVFTPNLAANSSNNRASRAFAARTGKTYYAILLNMKTLQGLSASTSSGGEYIMGLYTAASFATANGRGLVTAKLSEKAGKFVVGIRVNSTGLAGWVAKDLDTNTTHLIVVSHELTPASLSKIWVDPVLSAVEPSPDGTSTTGADANTDIGRFGIYQRGDKPKVYLGGLRVDTVWAKLVTGVSQAKPAAPAEFALAANYPNPFNPSTRIQFSVAKDTKATLKVYNMLGQMVATLFDGAAVAGTTYDVTFNASGLASGMYYSRLEADGRCAVGKMILLK